MKEEEFEHELADIEKHISALEEDLWLVQLREFPDSRRVELSEIEKWLDEEPNSKVVTAALDRSYSLYPRERYPSEIVRNQYIECAMTSHRLGLARWVSNALLYPAHVFYECGCQADGSYKHRGCRYGIKDSEYLSGYGYG